MVARLPRFLGVTADRLARTEAWFSRRGDIIVLLGRLVPGVRGVVSIPAGTLRMPLGRFTVLTAAGSLVWNTALIAAGTALLTRWQAVLGAVPTASACAVAAAAVAAAVLLVARRTRAVGVQR